MQPLLHRYDLRIVWSVPPEVTDQRSGRPLWCWTHTSPFAFLQTGTKLALYSWSTRPSQSLPRFRNWRNLPRSGLFSRTWCVFVLGFERQHMPSFERDDSDSQMHERRTALWCEEAIPDMPIQLSGYHWKTIRGICSWCVWISECSRWQVRHSFAWSPSGRWSSSHVILWRSTCGTASPDRPM